MIEAYARDGYAIVRGVFAAREVAEIGAAVDTVHAEGVAHGRSYRHGNLFYDVTPGEPPWVRMVQWPSWAHPLLDEVRRDSRIVRLLEPLIGDTLKQIINQLHWKRHGPGGDFAWHQDSRFRKPPPAYRNLGTAYVQTGLAIDPHGPASGGMRVVRGSHLAGGLPLDRSGAVLGGTVDDDALTEAGLSADDVVEFELDPGDMALWSPYLVHASGTNTSDHARRFYINGYVRADDCDRGEMTFRYGESVPLGPEPALVHYEQLREQPAPHYPDG